MFSIWSINKARPLRRKFTSFRQACALADRLEQRTGTPMTVVWP
jgi:hypothetical protein